MATTPPDAVFLIHGTFSHRDEDLFATDADHPDGRATWWQKNSDFVAEMDRLFDGRASCWPEDVCRTMPWARRSFWHRVEAWTIGGRRPFRCIRPKRRFENRHLFAWSGLNSETERRRAGRRLLEGLRTLEQDNAARITRGEEPRPYHLIGHSHGGSVIWNALRIAAGRGEKLERLKSWSTLGTPFPTYSPIRAGGLTSLAGLIVLAAFAWLALGDVVGRISPRSIGLTLAALLDPRSPANLYPYGVSFGTAGLLTLLLLIATWFLFTLVIQVYRLWESWRDSRRADRAWQDFGGRWLGLFSRIDEAIAGAQNTVGLYAADLIRLPWPGLPPVPRFRNAWDVILLPFTPLSWLIWLASWVTVTLANWVALPLAEWVISHVFRLKFQGSDRPGCSLTLISPEPHPRASSPGVMSRGPLPGRLEKALRALAGRGVVARAIRARVRFARDARSSHSPDELLRKYSAVIKPNNELIHNSYYNLDPIRRILAYPIVGADRDALGLDAKMRAWVEGESPARSRRHIPRAKPPSNTPAWTHFLLAVAFLLLCRLGSTGLKDDIDRVYVDRLLGQLDGSESPSHLALLRQAFEVFRPLTEPRLIEWIGQRDDETRLRGLAFLRVYATPHPDSYRVPPQPDPAHLDQAYLDSLIRLAFAGNTNPRVRVETIGLLLALPDRKEVGNRLTDQYPGATSSGTPNSDRKAAKSRFGPIVAATLFILEAEGCESLIGLLKSENDPSIRSAAARALGEIGLGAAPGAVGPLVARLGDPDSAVRFSAAEALGRLGPGASDGAVGPLVARLGDEDALIYEFVRKAVAEALGRLGPGAVGPLVARLGDPDPTLRSWAAQALGAIGRDAAPGAVGPLVERLGDPDATVRRSVAEALGAIGRDAAAGAVGPLVSRLGDPDLHVRLLAAQALGRLGPGAVGPLVARLGDPDATVRQSAAQALGDIGRDAAPGAVGPLVERLGDESASVRQSAARALGAIGRDAAAGAVGPLVERLGDKDAFVRYSMIEALGRLGAGAAEGAVGPLVSRLGDPDVTVRNVVADALGRLGRAAVGPLVARLGDPDPTLRSWAAQALGAIGRDAAPGAVGPLVERLGDPDSAVRFSATRALGLLGPGAAAGAIGPLVSRLNDSDGNVRSSTFEALGRLGPGAVGPLVARLGDPGVYVRSWAAEALGAIGRDAAPGAVGPLVERLGDESASVRWSAARALGAIGPGAAPGAVGPLTARLGDSDATVRSSASNALAAIDVVAAIEGLKLLLYASDDEDAKASAVLALTWIGPRAAKARPHLIARAISVNGQARMEALKALEAVGRKRDK